MGRYSLSSTLVHAILFWSSLCNASPDDRALLNNAITDYRNKDYESALAKLQKIDTSSSFQDMRFLQEYLWVTGDCFNKINKIEKAQNIYDRVFTINFDANPDKTDSISVLLLYKAGTFYASDKVLDAEKKSRYCLEKGMTLAQEIYGLDSAEGVILFMRMLKTHSNWTGDYIKALQIANNALSVWVQKNGEFNSTTLIIYKLISEIEYNNLNFKIALEYIYKILEISKRINFNDDKEFIASCWKLIGMINYEIDDYDIAINSFLKALSLYQKVSNNQQSNVIEMYSWLAKCYYQKELYDKALFYNNKKLLFFQNKYGLKSIRNIQVLYNIIACQTNLKKFEEAEANINYINDIVGYKPYLPNPFDIKNLRKSDILNLLYFQAKNQFFWYKDTGEEKRLRDACDKFDRIIGLIETIHSGYEESGSKQYLLNRYYYVFEQALNAHYELYQCTGDEAVFARALGYTERSRAILLSETLRRSDAGYSAGLPDSLRAALKGLREEIIQLENKRYLLLKGGVSSAPEVLEINQKLYTLGERRRQLEADARRDYPEYARAAAQPPPATLAQIQARLKPGEAWLTYFGGEDDLYAFLVHKDGFRFVHIPKDFPLEKWVEEMREAIYEYPMQRSDSLLHQYRERAWGLYDKLLAPFAWELPRRLVLAPDGVLKYLPFEALLSAAPGECALAECSYLLRRHVVSYAPSATLWLAELFSKPPGKINNKILAFAPSFAPDPAGEPLAGRRSSLSALAHNTEEARRIRRFFRADVVQGVAATRDRFVEAAAGYKVLHLATHAKADDENGDFSFLAFSKGPADTTEHSVLYARELYTIPLQAELVVLSACETGIGQFRRGEGLVSLAYGFAQAGARSIVTSLWRVSDKETSDLMGRFYAGLRRGLPKDEALHQAKLDYLSAQKGMRTHPFFWAAFVPQGDMSPLDMPGATPGWLWGIPVALALAAGALLLRRLRIKRRLGIPAK